MVGRLRRRYRSYLRVSTSLTGPPPLLALFLAADSREGRIQNMHVIYGLLHLRRHRSGIRDQSRSSHFVRQLVRIGSRIGSDVARTSERVYWATEGGSLDD